VAIQQYHVTARIFGGVFPNQGEEVFPMGIVAIIFIHDFDLPEMYSFKADVYVGSRLIINQSWVSIRLSSGTWAFGPMARRCSGAA